MNQNFSRHGISGSVASYLGCTRQTVVDQYVSDSLLLDLAGNSFVAGPFMAMLLGLVMFWPHVKKDTDQDAADEAILDALSRILP